jgi:hypothetical protein
MLGSAEECRRELWAGLPHLWGHERHQRRLLHTVYHRGGLDVLLHLLADLVCDGSLPLATALVLLGETRKAYGDEADMCEARGFEERCAALAMDRHPRVPVPLQPHTAMLSLFLPLMLMCVCSRPTCSPWCGASSTAS